MTVLFNVVYVYLIDGLKFVTKLIKYGGSFSEHEAAPTLLTIHHLYNIGVECSC